MQLAMPEHPVSPRSRTAERTMGERFHLPSPFGRGSSVSPSSSMRMPDRSSAGVSAPPLAPGSSSTPSGRRSTNAARSGAWGSLTTATAAGRAVSTDHGDASSMQGTMAGRWRGPDMATRAPRCGLRCERRDGLQDGRRWRSGRTGGGFGRPSRRVGRAGTRYATGGVSSRRGIAAVPGGGRHATDASRARVAAAARHGIRRWLGAGRPRSCGRNVTGPARLRAGAAIGASARDARQPVNRHGLGSVPPRP